MKILFSIIIPVFNSEKFLNDCVSSALRQTYHNYEIILVDDGSTDKSSRLCDYFAEHYECITTIHQKNTGPIQARINGVNNSKGDYLVFLDSDDLLRSDALEIIYKAVTAHHADLVMFCASIDKNFDKPFKCYPFETNRVFRGNEKNILYDLICTSSIINELALKSFRKSLFTRRIFSNDEKKVRNGDDCLLSLPVIDEAETIVFVDNLIYYYRPNELSIVHISNPKCFDSYRIVTEHRLSYAKKWNIQCPNLLKKTEVFASEQCYTAVRNVMTSDISWKEKTKEINYIKGNNFYKKYHLLLPKSFSPAKRFLYLMWLSNNEIISNIATLVYQCFR